MVSEAAKKEEFTKHYLRKIQRWWYEGVWSRCLQWQITNNNRWIMIGLWDVHLKQLFTDGQSPTEFTNSQYCGMDKTQMERQEREEEAETEKINKMDNNIGKKPTRKVHRTRRRERRPRMSRTRGWEDGKGGEEDGECEECPVNTEVSDDKRSCIITKCPNTDEYLTPLAECKKCSEYKAKMANVGGKCCYDAL